MSGREARKAARQDDRRRLILEAATAILERKGVQSLTMTAVARAANLTTSALYYYFANLEDLVNALAVAMVEVEMNIQLEAIDAAPNAVEGLCALIKARVQHYLNHPGSYAVLYEDVLKLGVSQKTLTQHIYPMSARVNDFLEQAIQAELDAGKIHPEVNPRRFANLAFYTSQGILNIALGMKRAGGDLRFGTDELTDEAVNTIRRAARPVD